MSKRQLTVTLENAAKFTCDFLVAVTDSNVGSLLGTVKVVTRGSNSSEILKRE